MSTSETPGDAPTPTQRADAMVSVTGDGARRDVRLHRSHDHALYASIARDDPADVAHLLAEMLRDLLAQEIAEAVAAERAACAGLCDAHKRRGAADARYDASPVSEARVFCASELAADIRARGGPGGAGRGAGGEPTP